VTDANTAPSIRGHKPAFPLALLVAKLMFGTFLFLTFMTAGPWLFTRGPNVAFGVVLSALPNLLLHFAFVLWLRTGNRWAAGAFGIWCVWGFIDSLAGAPKFLTAIFVYAFGVLNFVGIVGAYQGFKIKASQ
jgi:hypothetical protein